MTLIVGVFIVADNGPELSPFIEVSICKGGGALRVMDDGRGGGGCDILFGDVVEDVNGEKLPGARPDCDR